MKVNKGFAEGSCRDMKPGTVVQFERYGFARLDSINGEELTFVFSHK